MSSKQHYVESYRRALARACSNAGVEQWAPNRLRHTAATVIRRLYGLEAARAVLGHTSSGVTEQYAERDHEVAKRVASDIG